MPSSSPAGKSTILDWFKKNHSEIQSIIDIGPGMGTYFDLLNSFTEGKIDWACVEIWEPYIYRFKLYRKYKVIYNENIRNFIPDRAYDLVILGDVLEHMSKEDAIAAIEAVRKYAKFYIISLPLDAETNAPAGTGDKDWGNPYEIHRAHWSHEEFLYLPFADDFLVKHKEAGLGVYIGRSKVFDVDYFCKTPAKIYKLRVKFFRILWYSKKEIFSFFKKFIPAKIKKLIKKVIYLIYNPIIMENQNQIKINIGAGGEELLGFKTIDIDETAKPDIVCDIEKGLPLEDNSVDEIRCSHTLEHINNIIFVLKEFYRVCKNGAKITIVVPLMDASDMTHVRFFNEHTFRTLTEPIYWNKPNYFVGKYKEISRSFRELSTCREMILVLEVIK
ncbi:MAG: methyltransferase domain-containing protein [Candidatus Parcubacteria bacterium]|nr:methyltransferase domain-containing protein [Candidatus Parcubacteria bacterium]